MYTINTVCDFLFSFLLYFGQNQSTGIATISSLNSDNNIFVNGKEVNSDQSVKVSKIEVIDNEMNIDANKPPDADEKVNEIEQKSTESQAQDSKEIVATASTTATTTETEPEAEPASSSEVTTTPITTTTAASTLKTIPTAVTSSTPTKPIKTDIENVKTKSDEKEKESVQEKEKEAGKGKEKGKEKDKGKETSESSIVTPDYIQQSMFPTSLIHHFRQNHFHNFF